MKNKRILLVGIFFVLGLPCLVWLLIGSWDGEILISEFQISYNYSCNNRGVCSGQPGNYVFTIDEEQKIKSDLDKVKQSKWATLIGSTPNDKHKICGYSANYPKKIFIEFGFKDGTGKTIQINSKNRCIDFSPEDLVDVRYKGVESYDIFFDTIREVDYIEKSVPGITDNRLKELTFKVFLTKRETDDFIFFNYFVSFVFLANVLAALIQISEWCGMEGKAKKRRPHPRRGAAISR